MLRSLPMVTRWRRQRLRKNCASDAKPEFSSASPAAGKGKEMFPSPLPQSEGPRTPDALERSLHPSSESACEVGVYPFPDVFIEIQKGFVNSPPVTQQNSSTELPTQGLRALFTTAGTTGQVNESIARVEDP